MKRNGFTLVELLVVVAVLALLIIITTTNGFGVFNKAKEGINKIEEDNLIEAAKTYLVDVDNKICPSTMTNTECTNRKTACVVSVSNPDGCTITVRDIENYGYFIDKKDKCDNDKYLILKIEVDRDGNTIGYSAKKEDPNEVICSS